MINTFEQLAKQQGAERLFQNQLSGMHGGLANTLGVSGLGSLGSVFNDARQQAQTPDWRWYTNAPTETSDKKRPATIREELQAETDEWLEDI